MVALAGMVLAGCRPGNERVLAVDAAASASARRAIAAEPAAPDPRTHARAHVLLGIDFSRPLRLPECARYYNSFDRPEATCMYLRDVDRKPFKIEFADRAVPDFLKWNSAVVSTDDRGRPQMLRVDLGNEAALQGRAVDAMLATFGPPTRVENAAGGSKVGTWAHEDYVIRYFFAPDGGGIVQMETRRFHDAQAPAPAAADAGR